MARGDVSGAVPRGTSFLHGQVEATRGTEVQLISPCCPRQQGNPRRKMSGTVCMAGSGQERTHDLAQQGNIKLGAFRRLLWKLWKRSHQDGHLPEGSAASCCEPKPQRPGGYCPQPQRRSHFCKRSRAGSPSTFHIPLADTQDLGDDIRAGFETENLNQRVLVITQSDWKRIESSVFKGKGNGSPKGLVERSMWREKVVSY